MPNEDSGKDLQIIARSLYVRLLLHGVICITTSQHESKCFRHLSFFLSFPGHLSVSDWNTVVEKLAIRFQRNFTRVLTGKRRGSDRKLFDFHT